MNKIPAVIEDQINKYAKKLPKQRYVYHDSTIMTGMELKLSPFAETKAGEDLVDEKLYVVPIPGYGDVNHKRRMRHAYQEGGIEAVLAYIDQFIFERMQEPVAPKKPGLLKRLFS